MHRPISVARFGIILLMVVKFVDSNTALTPKQWYDNGVNEYLENHFDECIVNFEKALELYNSYTTKLQNCRLSCHDEAFYTEPLHPLNIDNLLFYEKVIKNTLCLIKCRKRDMKLFDSYNADADTIKIFTKRKPYEYLNACYAHSKQLQKAANAAFTYLVVNPNDSGVLTTFQYYIKQPDVNVNDIVNYEAKDYVYLYVHGTKAYEDKQWDEVVENMEASIESFLRAEEECRVQCEDPYDEGWNPDFIPAIANHFTHVLLCKRKCNEQLSTLNGEKHDDLLPSHYNYLQYAYFKGGKLKEACRAVASYLLFYPADKEMVHNWEYYKTLPKVEDADFEPRREALEYIHRHTYEEKIFNYITNVFAVEAQALYENDEVKESNNEITGEHKQHKSDLYMIANQKHKRFSIDSFLTLEQCKSLVQIANVFSLPGDGYQTGSGSPHTIHENYSGLSLKRAAKLLSDKQMDKESISLLLNVTEKAKQSIQDQFQVSKRLHFTYTHLVCRSAKSDTGLNRTDFSHPVHADNCNIQVNGTCPKEWPAFTWRDYTAILYLNENFDGGELFFASDYYGNQVEQMIRPACGRLVGFTSGEENLHGVTAIRQGTRCALAVWFTYDHNNFESERKFLYNILIPNK